MARKIRKSRADNIRWNQMIEALRLMNFGLNSIRLYPPNHSEVAGTLKRLAESFGPIFEEQEDIGFGFMDELLYIEGSMSIEETVANQMLVDRFSRCRVKYLTFMRGVSLEDITTLFLILNAESLKPTDVPPGEQLARKNIQTIHIVEAQVDDIASKSRAGKRKTLFDWYLKAVETLRTAQEALKASPEADLKPLYRFIDDMGATMRNKGIDPYLVLPALSRGLDPHLAHSVNVAILCCALGDMVKLNSGQINTLVTCAFLHDLGRVTIPTEWTRDHTPLSPAERLIARQHADWGFMLLSRHEGIGLPVALLAAHHHDDRGLGAGHPAAASPTTTAAAGYRPDVFHDILDIADVYELGMLSDKYYWKRQRPERLLAAMLDRRGVRFDPALVKLLIDCVGFYPVGSLVRLDDGRRAVVVRPNPANPARPKVYMFEESAPASPVEPASQGVAPASGPPAVESDEPPPVIVDTSELDDSGLAFKRSVVGNIQPPAGLDIGALLDKKKDYLLSYTI
ncbi:MAG: HD domain-containing protein [Elusimicrobia bacterium]|nr:HD domain-containing protein [Elusimicrobiota bacterium]